MNPDVRWRALPFQVVATKDGVVVKRGRAEIKIEGAGAADALRIIVEATSGEGARAAEVRALFPAPNGPAVDELLRALAARRFLVDAAGQGVAADEAEGTLDVFYWHFGIERRAVEQRLNAGSTVIVGVNEVSREIVRALTAAGLRRIVVVDDPLLRNVRFFEEAEDRIRADWPGEWPPVSLDEWSAGFTPGDVRCIVATSDFGGQALLRSWNERCVASGLFFLPVVLQDLIGRVGPFVAPGETACLECLRARENSHLADPPAARAAEVHAFEGQAVVAAHPAMATVVAGIAAIELTKAFGGLPEWRVGQVIDVNLLASRMTHRRVLKIPRCSVCSPLRERPGVSALQSAEGAGLRISARHSGR